MVERAGGLTAIPSGRRPPWPGRRAPVAPAGGDAAAGGCSRWLVLLLLLAACGRPAGEAPSPSPCRSSVPAVLANLTQAADPAAYAAQHDLDYRDGRVAVQIAVRGDPEAVVRGYDLDAQLFADPYYGPFLQARVPLDRLCALSHDQRVGAMAAPASPPGSARPAEQPLPRTDR